MPLTSDKSAQNPSRIRLAYKTGLQQKMKNEPNPKCGHPIAARDPTTTLLTQTASETRQTAPSDSPGRSSVPRPPLLNLRCDPNASAAEPPVRFPELLAHQRVNEHSALPFLRDAVAAW